MDYIDREDKGNEWGTIYVLLGKELIEWDNIINKEIWSRSGCQSQSWISQKEASFLWDLISVVIESPHDSMCTSPTTFGAPTHNSSHHSVSAKLIYISIT